MIWRLLRLLEHLLTGALISLMVTALHRAGHPPAWRLAVVRWWHERLCRIFALRVQVSGHLASPALLVANHISWLDIPVLGAQGPISFLSKAEVRRWPMIGWMATVAGTLFIERGAHHAPAVIAALRARLAQGTNMVLFAEGTTSDGAQVRRFLPRLFAVVQPEPGGAAMQLQPVALRYGQGPEPDAIAPFIGDDTLIRHLVRLLRYPGLTVSVILLPPIEVRDQDRRTLADTARAAILDSMPLRTEP